MIGIVKGGKHSYDDFGLTVRDATTETKKKNKTLVKIPFMNGSYDFSSLYGGQTYEEETRTYEFNLIAKDKYDLEIQKIKISDWLSDGEQAEIYDDLLVGYHRLAECVDLIFEENHNYEYLEHRICLLLQLLIYYNQVKFYTISISFT